MSARLTPYDNGTRLEPHVWVRGDVATPGGLPRRTEEDDYGRVDLDDDEGRTVLTLYVERTAEGYTLHVENLTDSLRIEVDHDESKTSVDEIVAAIAKAGYKATPSAF